VNNGGTPVLDFTVYYDQGMGTGDYIVLETNVLTPYYLTTVLLIPDVNYSFKISARNAVGSG
jgi:hypothetical protein